MGRGIASRRLRLHLVCGKGLRHKWESFSRKAAHQRGASSAAALFRSSHFRPFPFSFLPLRPSLSFFWRESQAEEKRKANVFSSFSSQFSSTRFFRSLFAAFLLLNTKTAVLWEKAPMRGPFFFFLSSFSRVLENVACGIFSKAGEKFHLFPSFSKDYFFSQNIFFRFFLHIKSINKEKRNSVPWRSWLAQQSHKLKVPGSTPGGTI